jgi:hypothetical protein
MGVGSFGHNWFPMIVGSNERLFGWMKDSILSLIHYHQWTLMGIQGRTDCTKAETLTVLI